jgi:hypothetical protein
LGEYLERGWRVAVAAGSRVAAVERSPQSCPAAAPLRDANVKGKCALGPFLSILVIECQHKCFCANLCKVVDKVQIMSKGMFLDLVHCFMD